MPETVPEASGQDGQPKLGRKNKHHTLPKSRIKSLNKRRLLKNKGAKKIDVAVHAAYHTIFQNSFPWEAIKKLKEWAKPKFNGDKKNNPQDFFDSFTANQIKAFIFLFGFHPCEFSGNGHLSSAINVIEVNFYAPQEVFKEYVQVMNGQKE